MPLDQQPQEKEVDEARAFEDDSGKSEQAEQAEKRPHRGETEEDGSTTRPPECSASSQNMTSEEDEEDEEDEEPRPVKRRKRNSHLTRQTLVHIEQPVSETSQSPSVTRELAPITEYQEWPFLGFLKHTRIANETTYNLEFKLPCMSKLFSLPIKAYDDEDVPTTPTTRPMAPSSKVSTLTSRPRTRVK
jgi:hypothetical protein